jgi:hypothetical protein
VKAEKSAFGEGQSVPPGSNWTYFVVDCKDFVVKTIQKKKLDQRLYMCIYIENILTHI